MSFVNFVNRVLMRNISDLHTFRLGCTRCYDVQRLNVWISTALARNLRELHLFFQGIYYYRQGLPHEVFTCTSLIVLELVGGFVLNVPTLVSLQYLKILLIQGLEFSDDDSIDRLFSGCPLLEELSVKRCNYKNISVFHISAPVLKSLVINFSREGGYNLVLNTPNLQNLEYKGYLGDVKSYSFDKLNALVNADIRLVLEDNPDRHYSVEGLVAEFVEGISKVQRLRYVPPIITYRLCRSPMPKFDRLICLEIGENVKWSLLLDFLERSPRLEKLIFKEIWGWYPPENVPSCLLFHLKEIEFEVFGGRVGADLEVAKYFLKNSKILEKLLMRIRSTGRGDMIRAYNNILRLFPRVSKKCRVVVS